MFPPPPTMPNPTRFRVRYGVAYCLVCGLAAQYCKGHAPSDVSAAQDGSAAASLERRINEAKR